MIPQLEAPIVFLGPMGAGKSSVARVLANATGIQQVPMDDVRWYFYFKNGYRLSDEDACSSFREKFELWKPFEVDAIERAIQDFPNCIIDFGAGHAHHENPEHRERVERAMAPLNNTFYLIPDESNARTLEICGQRIRDTYLTDSSELLEVNSIIVNSGLSRRLAKHTVITGEKTPEQVAIDILSLLRF